MRIINSVNKQTLSSIFFMDKLNCTSASIFYEDNVPYIDWKGATVLSDGSIANVHIPKMGLDISEISQEVEDYSDFLSNKVIKSKQVFVKDGFEPDEDIIITIKEREMTKEQIEKELGCKIKIKE